MEVSEQLVCLPMSELEAEMKATLDGYVAQTASGYERVEILSMTVDRGSVQCNRRRQLLQSSASSAPSVDVEMAIVFAEDATAPSFDQAQFETLEGVTAVKPTSEIPPLIVVHQKATPPQETTPEPSSGPDAGLVTGLSVVGGLVVIVGLGVFLYVQSNKERKQAEPAIRMIQHTQSRATSQLAYTVVPV